MDCFRRARYAILAALAVTAGCEVRDEPLPLSEAVVSEAVVSEAAPFEPAIVAPTTPVAERPAWQGRVGEGAAWNAAPASPRPETAAPRYAMRGKLRFVEGFEAGVQQSKAESKPMLVFFTAEWCHYCHAMEADAFHDARVAGLAKRFVCVLVDADAEQSVCQRYRVNGFPTVLFVSARGNVIHRLEGKQTSQELVRGMHEAFQSLARASQPDAASAE